MGRSAIHPSGFLVIAQSHPDSFLKLLEQLATELGPGELWTGMRNSPSSTSIRVRLGPSYSQKQGLAKRALSWSRFGLWTIGQALRERDHGRPLIVITNPPFLPHLALLFSLLTGRAFSAMIWDVYPDHLVHAGFVSERSLLIRVWHRLNTYAFRRARLLITLSEQMKHTLAAQARPFEPLIRVFPFWVDTQRIRPRTRRDNSLVSAWKLADIPIVLYAGNIGKTHSLETILDAANELHDRAQFLIVGHGLGRQALEERVRERSLLGIRFFDPVASEHLPELLALGDIAIVAQSKESAHLSLPSKTFSAMAAGSAILALTPQGSDLDVLIGETDAGISVGPDDRELTRSALETLIVDTGRRERAQRNARLAAETRFAQSVLHRQIVEALATAMRNGAPES